MTAIPDDLPCPCHGSDKLCPDCAGSGVVTAAAIVDAGVRYFADRARRNDTLAAMWGEW